MSQRCECRNHRHGFRIVCVACQQYRDCRHLAGRLWEDPRRFRHDRRAGKKRNELASFHVPPPRTRIRPVYLSKVGAWKASAAVKQNIFAVADFRSGSFTSISRFQPMSASPRIVTELRTSLMVRFVPIVLQKSFAGGVQNSEGRRRGFRVEI
jgi:hypothetical protein